LKLDREEPDEREDRNAAQGARHRIAAAGGTGGELRAVYGLRNLVFISGQICQWNGELRFIGKLGAGISIAEAQAAARLCALNILAHLRVACGGDLDRVRRIVRLGGFVNCTPEFTDMPQVVNGASDLMVAVFGDLGRHARAAVGVSSLPGGVAVEVEATFEIG